MSALLPFLIASSIWSASAIAAPNAAAPGSARYLSCRDDPAEYRLRSAELQAIDAADQADRPEHVMKSGTQARDRQRRERVGSIFGEGCFKDAKDFAAAALVFQHGDQPEHFFQAYIWAKRAVDLGDASMRSLMTRAIDRYLVGTGHKELFASQFFRPSLEPGTCWCLQQVEPTFTDALRTQYGGRPYQQEAETLRQMNGGLSCRQVECADALLPTPQGSVPGLW